MPSTEKIPPDPDDTLSCEVCKKEIPASEAVCAEAADYVLYYCGIACFELWREQSEEPAEQADTKPVDDNGDTSPR